MKTGGGPAYIPQYTELEEMVLSIIGGHLAAAYSQYDGDADYAPQVVIIIFYIPDNVCTKTQDILFKLSAM